MSELLLLLILAFIFIFTPDTYIGSKYRLSVYLICNNRYRPWKTHIGRPLIATIHIQDQTQRSASKQLIHLLVHSVLHLCLYLYVLCIFYHPCSCRSSVDRRDMSITLTCESHWRGSAVFFLSNAIESALEYSSLLWDPFNRYRPTDLRCL